MNFPPLGSKNKCGWGEGGRGVRVGGGGGGVWTDWSRLGGHSHTKMCQADTSQSSPPALGANSQTVSQSASEIEIGKQ